MSAVKKLFSLLSPSGTRARLSILIWHRVLPVQDPIFPEEMYASRFDATLSWIKSAFNVLSLPDAVKHLREGTLPSRALAITFDDGYEDNYSVALPILQKHGLTATFFISTGFTDGGCMWNDQIIETVRQAPVGLFDADAFGRFDLSDAASRRNAIDALIDQIKYLDIHTRQTTVDGLAQKVEVEPSPELMMTALQIRAMHQAKMTIGAHTCSHPILARLSSEVARTEIATGRTRLEEILGHRITLFAYPNGKPNRDYERAHVDMVRDLGFDAAVTTTWGTSRHGDNLFQLRRFSPWGTTRTRFLMQMAQNLMRQPNAYPQL